MSDYQEHQHDQRAFSCKHVVEDDRPILLVCHDHNGDWQFLCGETNHYGSDDIRILCCGCLFKKDESLKGIEALDIGFSAERENGDSNSWAVEALGPDEDEDEEE